MQGAWVCFHTLIMDTTKLLSKSNIIALLLCLHLFFPCPLELPLTFPGAEIMGEEKMCKFSHINDVSCIHSTTFKYNMFWKQRCHLQTVSSGKL